eukprot:2293197-Rhodomonas_salina.1
MEILSASVSRVLASDVIHVSVGECECLLTTTWVLGPAQRHALRVRRNPTRQRVWGSTHIENARLDLVGLEERSQNQVTLLAATSAISVPDRGFAAAPSLSIRGVTTSGVLKQDFVHDSTAHLALDRWQRVHEIVLWQEHESFGIEVSVSPTPEPRQTE